MAEVPEERDRGAVAVGVGLGAAVLALFVAALLFLLKRPSAVLKLTNLTISPQQVYQGEQVTIQVEATNIGEKTGPGIVSFYDNSDLLYEETITLEPAQTVVVATQLYPTLLGVHNITVNPGKLTGSFEVMPAPAENIELSNLVISPQQVYPGDTVSISVRAENIGGTPGSRTIVFSVGSSTYERDTGELKPTESITVTIQVSMQSPGTYNVEVDGLTGSFEVLEAYVPPYSLITPSTALPGLFKRIAFQAEGNFFAFYTIGSRIWVASSPNGGPGTWTAFDLGIDCRDYNFYSVFYHPGYNVVDLVWEAQEIVYWTRGVPRRNGTIEWGQGYNTGLTSYCYGQNCIDTYGYPWIASAGKVTTSKRNDNEWVTQDGYPVQHVSYGINTFFASAAVPLANGHVVHVIGNYSVYAGGGGITFRRWDGFYWGSPVSGPGTGSNFQGFCGVGIGSKLHVTSVPSGKIIQTNYAIYDSVQNAVVYSQAAVADGAAAVVADDRNQAHLFWPVGRILRYRKLDAQGIWSVPVDIVTDPDGDINGVSTPYSCIDPWVYTLYLAAYAKLKFKGLW